MELVQGIVVTFALLNLALLVFPNYCEALQCYQCTEFTQEALDNHNESNFYKNCISGGRPELVEGLNLDPNRYPVEETCQLACKRQEYSLNGKLLGVGKGCITLPRHDEFRMCLEEKLGYKPNCFRFTDLDLKIEIIKCIRKGQESSSADSAENLDDWSKKGLTKDGKKRGLDYEKVENDVCHCFTDYCNENSEFENNGAGISFKRTMATGGTGLMTIFSAILAALY